MPSARHLPRTVALLVGASLLAGCSAIVDRGQLQEERAAETVADEETVIVHRTATCECCGGYEDHLAAEGFEVRQQLHEDLTEIKDAFGIPESEASCHTNQIGGYAIEGHMPTEAIEQLLEEQPDVDGIALAGMPAGSPGMPGAKEGPFVVTLIDDGQVVGEFGRF